MFVLPHGLFTIPGVIALSTYCPKELAIAFETFHYERIYLLDAEKKCLSSIVLT
jgi:uncharacterized membrane protein SpoIIM required for sporulation